METVLPRRAARDVRRNQLIQATIAVLARKGYSAVTLADVAKTAGLSSGIVNFHFTSKDGLLEAVLNYLSTEYRENWSSRMRAAGPSPSAQLKAIVLADFDIKVFTPEKLAAWIAFFGEVQGRPVYDQINAAYGVKRRVMEDLCRQLAAEGGYEVDPHLTARMLEALSDGLWLGLAAHGVGHKNRVSAAETHKIVTATLAVLFPRHYATAA
jgi:AcrR family transcriptional regulator